MALRKLIRRNHGGIPPVIIKCHNLHYFKEGVILLCETTLETRQISHLNSSPLFTIPFKALQILEQGDSSNRQNERFFLCFFQQILRQNES